MSNDKRFNIDKDGRTILDSVDNDYCECVDSYEAKQYCKKLNELNDKTKMLKESEASTLREFIKGTKKIQKLAKENMELKSKLEYAEEVLNNIGYDLVHNNTENRWVIE